jgi:taurine transport system substrate-binding protein
MPSKIISIAVAAAVSLAMSIGIVQADDKTIIVGHFGEPTPAQLVRASDELSKGTGFKVEWRKFQSGTEVIAAMASGDVVISQSGSSPFVIGATQGVDAQMFMIEHGISTGEALIARNGSGIEKLEDLKGKKVGVPLGSTSHYSLMGALANAGIKSDEVTILGMTPDQIAAAWSQGQIDATFVWDPVRSKALENGKMIISAGEVTGNLTYNAWVVNTAFAKEHPDFMVAFVKAMDKADAEYNSNPTAWTPDSDVVKTLAQMTGAAPADIPAIAKGYSFPSVADQLSDKWFGGAVQQGLPSIAKFLVEQKRIPKALDDYSPFVNTEFLKKAAQ